MRNLTELEIDVLEAEYNLADGHAYRKWGPLERSVVDSAAEIFRGADRARQAEIEREYLEVFFALAGQTFDRSAMQEFFCFTASSAIEAVANHLRIAGQSVALVEPCFDNLSDILRRHGVPLHPLTDRAFGSPAELSGLLSEIEADAVFVVSPNNPTGRRLDRETFDALIEHCAGRGRTLILDACFRFYLGPEEVYDQYRMLIDSGIDWVVIEDTGKTWPSAEIKAPFFCASPGLAVRLGHIYSDFLLHVSPFALGLLTGFLRGAAVDGLSAVNAPVAANRELLREHVLGSVLCDAGAGPSSVAWLGIEAPIMGADLTRRCAEVGVHVLAGDRFHWHDERFGASFMRVALARDPERFKPAAELIGQVCSAVAPEGSLL